MISFPEKFDDILVRYLAYFNYRNYVARLNLRQNENVLEIGCGGGNLSRFIASKVPYGKLTCADISSDWIKEARRRLRKFNNIVFVEGSIEDIRYETEFDSTIIHYMFHDLPCERRKEFTKALKGLLKESGKVYIREPTRESHGIPPKEIRKLMSQEGFLEKKGREGYSFPLRGKVYEGIFQKK